MPRTKVAKGSKRNREAALREEKTRDYETSLDDFLSRLENKAIGYISDVENMISMLEQRTPQPLLQMRMSELLELDLMKFTDWRQNSSVLSQTMCSSSAMASSLMRPKTPNPNDEGYLTEDSSRGGGSSCGSSTLAAFTGLTHLSSQQQQQQQRGRTPGPLCSARARRPRRSRSACGDILGSALKPKPSVSQSTADHAARSKMRTPIAARPKAFSADRTPKVNCNIMASPQSPPTALMRWPKPGELVLSKCGSPVVAQVMQDKYANVNIPVRNGVLSLRPKKLQDLKPDIIESIDAETLNQIKTLHANLNLIMNMADKAALK